MRLAWFTTLSGALVLLSGCAQFGEEQDESPGSKGELLQEAAGALTIQNALSLNALSLNALSLNALSLNALSLDGLSAQNLQALRDPGTAGQLSRQFLHYAVGCALESGQSFTLPWTDTDGAVRHETYAGELGLIDSWKSRPLKVVEQRLVSACLAARVNLHGVSVTISIRSPQKALKLNPSSTELQDFPQVEGAFWGNLFAPTPQLFACHNSATIGNSRAWQRDCTTGYLNEEGELEACGPIQIVGACSEVCKSIKPSGQYYPECMERPGQGSSMIKEVITTALP
ncbi:hypothetical protein [Chondromyces crocatus]|uniref:Lipoprotein n=1 Tax=Chondromyces crocatus TaxID=52 RepID=A0A0K1EFI0_CHOCO|nr:hypothetical protein [Chondromyces crocatus]AKT39457.1 uncharacterized protein CMC5_036040 [Chondromyces crocatus]